MVEHADVDERERVLEALRELLVALAGRRVAGRVVVRKDQRGGIAGERNPNDLAG